MADAARLLKLDSKAPAIAAYRIRGGPKADKEALLTSQHVVHIEEGDWAQGWGRELRQGKALTLLLDSE